VLSELGCNPGLDGEAKLAFFPTGQERFLGDSRDRLPDSISGLIMGDSESKRVQEKRGSFPFEPVRAARLFVCGDGSKIIGMYDWP
jgi:hypothetical protein